MARIAGINIPQNKVVSIALTYIHGIGLHSSKKICKKLDLTQTMFCYVVKDKDNKLYSIGNILGKIKQ